MAVHIDIIKPFETWLNEDKRIKVAFGGRGGGKSESILRMLLVLSFTNNDSTFLFARETEASIKHSTYSLIIYLIKNNQLTEYFHITKKVITNKITNVKFIFTGLREYSIDKVKSIHNIKYCFIEEGQTITQGSWEVLEPSIRASKSEIWWAFNPRKLLDPIYQTVSKYTLKDKIYTKDNEKNYNYSEYIDKNTLITKVNYDGNHFFSEILETSRSMSLKNTPNLYGYIWLGELKREQGRIFLKSKLKFFNVRNYKKNMSPEHVARAIIDPAFGGKNCFTSCLIYVKVKERYYILDSGLMRNDDDKTTDESITEFLNERNIKEIMCEANFQQGELIKKLRQKNFIVTPFYVRTNKIERIINASIPIRENCYFDERSLITPDESDIFKWIRSSHGRNFIAMMQLLDFSDNQNENCIKGDDFSFIDFPDALASLVLYSKNYSNNLENNTNKNYYILFNSEDENNPRERKKNKGFNFGIK